MVSILLHRLFLLLDPLWHWYSLLHFLFLHCNLQLQFLCVFYDFSMKFLILFIYCFSCILFITCLSLFSCSSLNFVKTCILSYLLGKPLICISLQFIASKLLRSFGSVMFPQFFIFLEVLHFWLRIWRYSYLKYLLTDFMREISSFNTVRIPEAFSDLFYRYTCPRRQHTWLRLCREDEQ